ncbi:hypothetical protein EWM64_g10812 [Hericium alpestre]|uniref:Uncharacterized protein n=1 Tax=Hericium alpestre TaxID=135208 RepID=A0A4Y9ZGA4_9AGAM|nr:hypothetical protein EWM64_g10812 [Hericium alpestre]
MARLSRSVSPSRAPPSVVLVAGPVMLLLPIPALRSAGTDAPGPGDRPVAPAPP